MYGPSSSDNSSIAANREETMGIIPRVIKGIFELASSVNVLSLSVYCSFVQIYNENLYDMPRYFSVSIELTLHIAKRKAY